MPMDIKVIAKKYFLTLFFLKKFPHSISATISTSTAAPPTITKNNSTEVCWKNSSTSVDQYK